jgi:DNA invertase Pin-like site-specific DNA recombinase
LPLDERGSLEIDGLRQSIFPSFYGVSAMRFVFYKRVSHVKSLESGLGLNSQDAIANGYISQNPGSRIIHTFEECESGRQLKNRPQLQLALEMCRAKNARLLISDFSRVSRSVSFCSALMDSDIEFVVASNPNVSRLTLHVLASVNEEEARAAGERSRNALAEKRKREGDDCKLGAARTKLVSEKTGLPIKPPHRLTPEQIANGLAASQETKKKSLDAFYSRVLPVIRQLRLQEKKTFQEIADILNKEEWSTYRTVRIEAKKKKLGDRSPTKQFLWRLSAVYKVCVRYGIVTKTRTSKKRKS